MKAYKRECSTFKRLKEVSYAQLDKKGVRQRRTVAKAVTVKVS